jgi:hypothetical protein
LAVPWVPKGKGLGEARCFLVGSEGIAPSPTEQREATLSAMWSSQLRRCDERAVVVVAVELISGVELRSHWTDRFCSGLGVLAEALAGREEPPPQMGRGLSLRPRGRPWLDSPGSPYEPGFGRPKRTSEWTPLGRFGLHLRFSTGSPPFALLAR